MEFEDDSSTGLGGSTSRGTGSSQPQAKQSLAQTGALSCVTMSQQPRPEPRPMVAPRVAAPNCYGQQQQQQESMNRIPDTAGAHIAERLSCSAEP